MKTTPLLMLLLIMIACTKEVKIKTSAAPNFLTSSMVSDTVRIPLIDLGDRTYFGYRGYLYPNLSNQPSGQYALDLRNFANSIVPRDTMGIPNSKTGKIAFISIGASTCSIMTKNLREKTEGNPLTNPNLVIANCTNASTSINEIMDPNDSDYWDIAIAKLLQNRLTPAQVAVIYLETDDSVETNGFPERPLRTKDEYEQAIRTFKIKFKNVKMVYLLGRTTTFLKPRPIVHNVEPCPYYNGWACKWVIEDQIKGVPGTEYKGVNAVAPLVTWGWYEWADGSAIPRSDGFTWQRWETLDGLHANSVGGDTLATRFQNFLLTDPYARIWYARHK